MAKSDIIIKHLENGCFDVVVGDKSTDQLSFDEMLGVIAQLTIPKNKRCLNWLKTKEEHEAFRNRNTIINN
jgi:hypothetical protein